MLKLVYYIDDAVVSEKEVSIDDIDSAIGEVIDQDYSDYVDDSEEYDGSISTR